MDIGESNDRVDSLPSSSSSRLLCRYCHEEEDENSASIESPCSCSGSLKFAHRSCIQRWIDEKGSGVCEICLQEFKPGYSIPSKLLHIAVTIRRSVEVPRLDYEEENQELHEDESDDDIPQCTTVSDRCNWIRYTIFLMALVLLARHSMDVVTAEEGEYALAVSTVLLLRIFGILLPFYCIMRVVSAIQRVQQRNHRRRHHRRVSAPTEENEEEQSQITIQIQS